MNRFQEYMDAPSNSEGGAGVGGPSHLWQSIIMSPAAAPGNYISSSPRSACISEDQSSVKSEELSNIRVKLMCSYGGKILPRPHDNQLRYMGGETRILSVDRNITLPELMRKLNRLPGKPVLVKYQLPGEDLDALISVRSEEDLENMMDEYDRLTIQNSSSRLRVFLFPEYNMKQPVDDLRSSDQQFVDALNGIAIPQLVKAHRRMDSPDVGEDEMLFDFQFQQQQQQRKPYGSPRSVSPHKLPPARIPVEAAGFHHPDALRHHYWIMQQQQQQQGEQQQQQPQVRSSSRSPTRGDDSPRTRAVSSPSRFRDAAAAVISSGSGVGKFSHLGMDHPAMLQAAYEHGRLVVPGAPVHFHPHFVGRVVGNAIPDGAGAASSNSPDRASEFVRHK